MLGNKVTNASITKLTIKNGNPALLTLAMDTFPMLDEMNKHTPTGGVVKPMMRFKTAITAKWIGSISTEMASFSKMGNRISKAAMVSIKVPTKINKMLIIKSTIYLFVEIPKISVEIN